jgi:hypothetical protein
MAWTTIALAAAVLGMALLLLPMTEMAARARVRAADHRTRGPDKKPKT